MISFNTREVVLLFMNNREFVEEVEDSVRDDTGLVNRMYDEIIEIAEENDISSETFSDEQAEEIARIVIDKGFNPDNFE